MTDRISSIPDARECIGAMVNERLAMSRYTSRPMQCSLFVMAAIALIPFSGQIAGAVTTCKLVPVPFSEPDILNPGRGYYNELWWEFFWVDINKQQSPADSGYFYNRYLWCDLEPRQDDYQFAMIDKDIARAKAAGRKFGFRVMPHNNNLTGVPAYIAALGGTWVDGGFWPKWDNSFVIERMDKLYAALSAKYDGNPALAFIDFGLYGKWGEWHGEPAATLATKKKIADIHMKYWKQTRLLMQFSDDSSIVGYVMRGRPRIGARADNIGSWIFDGFTSTDPATGRNWFLIGEIASERWKTAPIITEWCGCQDTPENALRQVRDHHVVALGDNSAFTTNRDIGKALGFRFVLDSLTYPSTVVPGTTITIQSWWSNAGVTPAYEKWETRYEIYNGKGTLIFSTSGILDFETFLPGRKSVTDSVKLPSTVAGGACRFALTVADPSGYYTKPLSLAVKGIDSKGRYTLGDIIVQERTGARVAPGRTFIDNQDRVPKRSILLLRQCQYESVAAGRMFTLRGERISNRPGTIKGLLRTGVYFISAAAVLLRNPCHGKRGQFF